MRNDRPKWFIESGLCVAVAVGLLVLPLPWVSAWIVAAMIHELGHIFAIRMLRLPIISVRLGLHGAIIETASLNDASEIICTLAGPAGSLLLIFLGRVFPRLAICAAVQAVYNLIPLYPLDGGRITFCLIQKFAPISRRTKIWHGLEAAVLTVLGFFAVWCAIRLSLGVLPIILYALLVVKNMKIKFPCKRGREGVQ